MIMEPPDYRKLYEEQCKVTETWRNAADLFRETLRDNFAATCPVTLSEFCESISFELGCDEGTLSGYARVRFRYADTMIAARGEVKP